MWYDMVHVYIWVLLEHVRVILGSFSALFAKLGQIRKGLIVDRKIHRLGVYVVCLPLTLNMSNSFRVILGTSGRNLKTVHWRVKRTKFGPWMCIYTHMGTFDLEHVKIILPFFRVLPFLPLYIYVSYLTITADINRVSTHDVTSAGIDTSRVSTDDVTSCVLTRFISAVIVR